MVSTRSSQTSIRLADSQEDLGLELILMKGSGVNDLCCFLVHLLVLMVKNIELTLLK